jgi:hypothetical protein
MAVRIRSRGLGTTQLMGGMMGVHPYKPGLSLGSKFLQLQGILV